MKQLNLQIRIDEKDKMEAESVFDKLGISTSQAIKLFLRQVVLNQGLPFKVQVPQPNQDTLEAIQEIQNMMSGKIRKEGKPLQEFIESMPK